MKYKKVWVGTSKSAKLNRVYLLQTGQNERDTILQCVEDDLKAKTSREDSFDLLTGNALIEDIPYYVEMENVKDDSFLFDFKVLVYKLLNEKSHTIEFSKKPFETDDIKNFEENEGIKFLALHSDTDLYFMNISNNTILKNKFVMSLNLNENSLIHKIPKGIQVPSAITAKYSISDELLYVYDVNKFESMLTLNENIKAKSQSTLGKFIKGEYKVGSENYMIKGLEIAEVQQALSKSQRALRRLAKYHQSKDADIYPIERIKEAVSKLDASLQVVFNDSDRSIIVNEETAKTFVGIIHNSIVMRLISGEVEIAI